MSRQKKFVDDTGWPEVGQINSYAIFMGYLLMGVRGLGLLVLTWTTVVLLGGFVSILRKKDFWSLTAITLVQTAGVFDFLLKEKASDIGNSFEGLLVAVGAVVLRPFRVDINNPVRSKMKQHNKVLLVARVVLAFVLIVAQALVLAIILCPLAVLYVLGLYLSAAISLWRLIQHDYGSNNADGSANLKPALNVLYSLAIAQGVVYGYRTIYDLVVRTRLVEEVANEYSLEVDLVSEYLDETVAGCMKDPSFARGRNLVTYGVDLLRESKSRYGYISGVLILGKVTLHGTIWMQGQPCLVKQLLAGSASFSHVVQRLVETFGPRSPYSTEIRLRAARIVATVAGDIRLEQFPDQGMTMLRCISSLLDTSEEYSWRPEGYDERRRGDYLPKEEYERGWLLDEQEICYGSRVDRIPAPMAADKKTQAYSVLPHIHKLLLQGYKGLLLQGLYILEGLAVDEDNCRVICNTQGLLSKAIAPLVVSDQLHSGNHHEDEWCSIADESLELMKRLMATPYPQETETKLIISTLIGGIIECLKCHLLLQRQAVELLLHLSVDTRHTPDGIGSSSTMFLWMLLHISFVPDYHYDRMCGSTHLAHKSCDIARLADQKLQTMLSSPSQTAPGATSMVRSVGDVICSLATAVADAGNNAYIRVHAGRILNGLVRSYTKNDENLKQLKKAMTDMMPEVLKEIVLGPKIEEGPDLEQGGGVPHDKDNGQESSSTPHQQKGEQHQGFQLQEALIQLCCAVDYEWTKEDKDLTRQFNEIAAKICSGQRMPHKTFGKLVQEAQLNMERTRELQRQQVQANSSK